MAAALPNPGIPTVGPAGPAKGPPRPRPADAFADEHPAGAGGISRGPTGPAVKPAGQPTPAPADQPAAPATDRPAPAPADQPAVPPADQPAGPAAPADPGASLTDVRRAADRAVFGTFEHDGATYLGGRRLADGSSVYFSVDPATGQIVSRVEPSEHRLEQERKREQAAQNREQYIQGETGRLGAGEAAFRIYDRQPDAYSLSSPAPPTAADFSAADRSLTPESPAEGPAEALAADPGIGPQYAAEDFWEEPVRTVDDAGNVTLAWQAPAPPPPAPAPPPAGIGPQYAAEDFYDPPESAAPADPANPYGVALQTRPEKDDFALVPDAIQYDSDQQAWVGIVNPEPLPSVVGPAGETPLATPERSAAFNTELENLQSHARSTAFRLMQENKDATEIDGLRPEDILTINRQVIAGYQALAAAYPEFAALLADPIRKLESQSARIEFPPPTGSQGSAQDWLDFYALTDEVRDMQGKLNAAEYAAVSHDIVKIDPIHYPYLVDAAYDINDDLSDQRDDITQKWVEWGELRDKVDPGWRDRWFERIYGFNRLDALQEVADLNDSIAALGDSDGFFRELAAVRDLPVGEQDAALDAVYAKYPNGREMVIQDARRQQLLNKFADIQEGGGQQQGPASLVISMLPYGTTVQTYPLVTDPDSPGGKDLTTSEKENLWNALQIDALLLPLTMATIASAPGASAGAKATFQKMLTDAGRIALVRSIPKTGVITARDEAPEQAYELLAETLIYGEPDWWGAAKESGFFIPLETATELTSHRRFFTPGGEVIAEADIAPSHTGENVKKGALGFMAGTIATGSVLFANPGPNAVTLTPQQGPLPAPVVQIYDPGAGTFFSDPYAELVVDAQRTVETERGRESIAEQRAALDAAEADLSAAGETIETFTIIPESPFPAATAGPAESAPAGAAGPAVSAVAEPPAGPSGPPFSNIIIPELDDPDKAADQGQGEPAFEPADPGGSEQLQDPTVLTPDDSLADTSTADTATAEVLDTAAAQNQQENLAEQTAQAQQENLAAGKAAVQVTTITDPDAVTQFVPDPVVEKVAEDITQVVPDPIVEKVAEQDGGKVQEQIQEQAKAEEKAITVPDVTAIVQAQAQAQSQAQTQAQARPRKPDGDGEAEPDLVLKTPPGQGNPKIIEWLGLNLNRLNLATGQHTITPTGRHAVNTAQVVEYTPKPVDSSYEAGSLAVRTEGGQTAIRQRDRRIAQADPMTGGGRGMPAKGRRRHSRRGGRKDEDEENKEPMAFRLMITE